MAAPLLYPLVHGTSNATDIVNGNVGMRAEQRISVGADVTAASNLPSLSPPSTLLPAVRGVSSPATNGVTHPVDNSDAEDSSRPGDSWMSGAPAERVCAPAYDRPNEERVETEPPWDDEQAGHRSMETSTSARALVTPESSSLGSFDETQPQTVEEAATSGNWDWVPGGEQRPFWRRAWTEGKTHAEGGGVWIPRAARARIMATAPISAGVSSSTTFFLDEALDADDQATVWLRKQQLQQLRRSCLANTGHSEERPPPILLNPALSDDSRIHLPQTNHDDRPEIIGIFSPMTLSQGDARIVGRSLTEVESRELKPPPQQMVGAGGVDGGGAVGVEPAVAMGWAPSVWVARYVDYSSKFGRLFLLTDGTISILFNDDTRMVIEPAGFAFDYMEHSVVHPPRQELELAEGRGGRRGRGVGGTAGLQRFKMRYTVDFFPFFLNKKVQILRHCRDRIVQEVGELVTGKQVAVALAKGEGDAELDGGNTERPPLVFVDRWQRSSRTNCFRLSDRTVQARTVLCIVSYHMPGTSLAYVERIFVCK